MHSPIDAIHFARVHKYILIAFQNNEFSSPSLLGPMIFTLNCCNKYIKLPATLITECISEAQRNLLDYDFTYEILYSINVYIIYM